MNLAHLSVLTALDLQDLTMSAGSQLPPALQALNTADCQEADSILALQHLVSLTMLTSSMPAGEIVQLSSLTQLTCLELHYEHSQIAAMSASSGAWPALPLQNLAVYHDMEHDPFPADLSLVLSKLTRLTALELVSAHKPFATTATSMAACLRQLTNLEQLTLYVEEAAGHILQVEEAQDAHLAQQQDSYMPVLSVLAYLPHLLSFSFRASLMAREIEQLAAAGRHLTHLAIYCPGLKDYDICLLATRLTGLQSLSVGDGEYVSDASAVVISAMLTQLVHLAIRYTAIADTGAKHFTNLGKLVNLDVRDTGVSLAMLEHIVEASNGRIIQALWGAAP